MQLCEGRSFISNWKLSNDRCSPGSRLGHSSSTERITTRTRSAIQALIVQPRVHGLTRGSLSSRDTDLSLLSSLQVEDRIPRRAGDGNQFPALCPELIQVLLERKGLAAERSRLLPQGPPVGRRKVDCPPLHHEVLPTPTGLCFVGPALNDQARTGLDRYYRGDRSCRD